jgi:CDP-diacylglycerol--glycerol-3-phosphate 3-phosphatidyltransferase
MIVYLINALTLSRIFIAMIIFFLLMLKSSYLLAFILFFIAGLTDYLDGFLARKYDKSSQIGEVLDPIADKILIIFLFFGLALNLSSYLIGFAGALIITREIWVSALRDFNSRNNNSNATKVIYIAKIKTTIQLFTISIYLFSLSFNIMLLIPIADIFMIISVLITIYTGYMYTVKTFKN